MITPFNVKIKTTIRGGLPVTATGTYVAPGRQTTLDPGWSETVEDLEVRFLSGSLYKKPLYIFDEDRIINELIAEYKRGGE